MAVLFRPCLLVELLSPPPLHARLVMPIGGKLLLKGGVPLKGSVKKSKHKKSKAVAAAGSDDDEELHKQQQQQEEQDAPPGWFSSAFCSASCFVTEATLR